MIKEAWGITTMWFALSTNILEVLLRQVGNQPITEPFSSHDKHVKACHMPGSVLSPVNSGDDLLSLQYNWKNRPKNWQLLGHAKYYAGGRLWILWRAHRDIVGTQIGSSGVRGGFLELKGEAQWKRCRDFVDTSNSTCKSRGTCTLVSRWLGRSMTQWVNRSTEGAYTLANTSWLIQPQTTQSSFPMLWHEIDHMILPFHPKAVFGLNQGSKAT